MRKILFAFLLVGFLFSNLFSQNSKHSFTLSKTEFLLDGKPFQIIAGEIHPARVPVEYWKHRIQMAKAMGCNTIAAYIFWNYHEIELGVFDSQTGNHNITKYINPFLEILVEGMGRINFAEYMIDRKVITERVSLNGMTLMNWEIFTLPFDDDYPKTLKYSEENSSKPGNFFKGEFELNNLGDTYIDMTKWEKVWFG